MSVRINSNIEALNAQRNLGATAASFAKSVEKLSSGLRINRAADDAAGLAISEKLRAQVRGLNQAQRNAQDGISMVQTAEGAMNEIHSMLQRVRELSVQASNSTLSSSDAQSVNTEVVALQSEVNRVAQSTTFNGQYLLTGALSVGQSGGTLAVGTSLATGAGATVSSVDVSAAKASTTYTITSQAGGKVTLSDGTGNSQQITLVAGAATVTANFSNLGVKIGFVGSAAKTAAQYATDLAAISGGGGNNSVGGVSGANLVVGDVMNANTTITATGAVTYGAPTGLDLSGGATPLTATASAGVSAGSFHIGAVGAPGPGVDIDTNGHISVAYDGETFTGDLAGPVGGASSTAVLTGSVTGHTITLAYKQGATPSMSQIPGGLAYDVSGSTFVFVAGGSAATVTSLSAGAAAAGTYTFTSSGPGSITLTGPGAGPSQTIAIADTAANATQTLNFATLGISIDLHANGLGTFTKESAMGNLTSAGNNAIVVVAGGGGGGGGSVTTGGASGANFQIGANAGDSLSVSFTNVQTVTYTGFDAAVTAFTGATGSGAGIIAAAQALITVTDTALSTISSQRGTFGAVQNRLEHTIASLGVSSENLAASESRIRDLDVASEMVSFTKTQILQQAGTAILAQANQAPQSVLSLLK